MVVEDEVVDHYDLELERGAAELARTLHEIVEENIEREASACARLSTAGTCCPKTSRPARARSAVTLDDAVGDELQRARAALRPSQRQPALAASTARAPQPDVLERAGRRDPIAERLGLRGS